MKSSNIVYCKNINFLLKAEFSHRQLKNSLYSLRAFARDLNITVSSLHGYLNNQKLPSLQNIKEFCKVLKLETVEAELYYTPVKNIDSINGIQNLNYNESEIDIDIEIANSDLYHLAYMGLDQLNDYDNSPQWIGKKLKIDIELVEQIENRLLKLKRLHLNEMNRPVRSPKRGNLAASRNYGTKIEEAKKLEESRSRIMVESMDNYSKDELVHSVILFSSNKDKILEGKEKIKHFRRELATLMEQTESKEDLYCLSINLNPMT